MKVGDEKREKLEEGDMRKEVVIDFLMFPQREFVNVTTVLHQSRLRGNILDHQVVTLAPGTAIKVGPVMTSPLP